MFKGGIFHAFVETEKRKSRRSSVILSVSRRTDIPRFHVDWFVKRLEERFALVRNPVNRRLVYRVPTTPDTVDAIIFWTKDPRPLFPIYRILKPYPHYWQFTLNGYGQDIEPLFAGERGRITDAFRELSDRVGPEALVWRYDPVLFSETYTAERHIDIFAETASMLSGRTVRCVTSFLDIYAKISKAMKHLGAGDGTDEEKRAAIEGFSRAARENGMELYTCSEEALPESLGVSRSRCVDPELLERICGFRLTPEARRKDPFQRRACGCAPSVDIGAYNTCGGGCLYCYGTSNSVKALQRAGSANSSGPLLCDELRPDDCVSDRKVLSCKRP